MGALDQVTQLKNEGASDEEIIGKLREQNISPKAINDAMEQSKIKDAVSKSGIGDEVGPPINNAGTFQRRATIPKGPVTQEIQQQSSQQPFQQPQQPFQQTQQPVNQQEYYEPRQAANPAYPEPQQYQQPAQAYPPAVQNQQPVAQQPQQPVAQQEYYEPQPEYYDEGGYEDYGADYGGDYGQEAYDEEYYPQEGYGQDYYGSGTDTMIEIAEQVFIEKTQKIQEQLEDLNEFKTLAETKLTNATSRLKRIEESIDHLQAAILEKVGSYGRGLDNIKKEMAMMQESFSKTLPALAHRHAHSTTTHKPATKKTVSRKKR
jgi:hypothetical protein